MEDMTSSKLALRSLLKDSKEKRVANAFALERPRVNTLAPVAQSEIPETDEKRKEQLKLGKVIFEFFEQKPAVFQDEFTAPVQLFEALLMVTVALPAGPQMPQVFCARK